MASLGWEQRPFVGRRDELRRFDEVLTSPEGQAVVVVGQAGMGKTMLVNRMARCALDHPNLKCGFVRYEVTPSDSPASTMALMIDHAFEAAGLVEKAREDTERRHKQWDALIKLLPKGGALVDLRNALRRDPQRDTRDQFIERLDLISRRLPDNGRAIFIVDPEKYMQPGSQDDWRLVVRELPDRIKFVFAQRPDDVLISSRDFMALENVRRIPDDGLDVLDEQAVEDLLNRRAPDLKAPIGKVREAIGRYNGHPYAVPAALDLIADGRPLKDLPPDPTPERIAEAQWNQVCDAHGKEAIELFEAYALLEVPVPDEVVEPVSGLTSSARRALLANPYLAGLLREEPDGRRIYHSLLVDHIGAQLSDEESKPYHQRAVDIYRRRLNADVKPDALAAVRLAEHVLAAEGPEAFVTSFVNECDGPLSTLGLLDATLSLSHRALEQFVVPGSAEEAVVRGNLGLVYKTRGDLDRAEEMHRKALQIEKDLGRLEGTASQYGNLGLIYRTHGNLDKAEKMHRKSLAMFEQLGRLEGVANQYGSLGLIYQTRGDLDQAEGMLRKSLAIEEKLGRLEGIANAYGNLGVIYRTRGELDKAEEMLRKSLAIDEKLGRLEGIASAYGNLGLIYRRRGDLDEAETMHRKALEIEEKLGRPEGMAAECGNLGLIYLTCGDLDRAEQMHGKSLAINEKLGCVEGVAKQYGILGMVYEQRGNLAAVREYWTKARDLFAKIGMPHMVTKMQGWIDGLPSS